MLLKTPVLTLSVVVASLLALGAAQAQTPAPPPEPATVQPISTPPVPVEAPKAETPPEKVAKVCHYVEISGSMIPKRVCN